MVFGLDQLKENTDYFGLDLGTNSIKIVQLKKNFGKFELVAFGSAPLAIETAQSDSEIDKKKISDIIKNLIHSMHLVTKNVIVSLPGSAIFTTVLTLPKMPVSDLKKAVIYQAEQNIPLKISDVKIDWQIIGEISAKDQVLVMVIAAPISKTDKVVEIIEGAGLELYAVEIDSLAVSRSLQGTEPLFMAVNLGTFVTEVSVVRGGVVTFTRTIPVGGKVISRSIAQGLNLEEEQAEQFKKKFGIQIDAMEGQLFSASRSVLNILKEEVDRSMKYYLSQFGENINLIKLTGGASRTLGIQKFLMDNLGINVIYGNPWASVSHAPDINSQLSANACDFAVAVGLAMRGI